MVSHRQNKALLPGFLFLDWNVKFLETLAVSPLSSGWVDRGRLSCRCVSTFSCLTLLCPSS